MTPRQGWAGGTWTPKTEYASDVDDLAVDFYEPAMSGAMCYDRITGYFSSGAFILYWRGLRAFAARGGRLRLLCSPAITDPDGGSIRLGYQARDGLRGEVGRAHGAGVETGREQRQQRGPAGSAPHRRAVTVNVVVTADCSPPMRSTATTARR